MVTGPASSPSPAPSNSLDPTNFPGIRTLSSDTVKNGPLTIVIIALIMVVVILLEVAFFTLKRSKKRLSSRDGEDNPIVESQDGDENPIVESQDGDENVPIVESQDGEENSIVESLNYSLRQVQNATNDFSEDCKIGRGGFGIVYKGTLPNGQDVAVKRLSKSSTQGLKEFKNEILLLAKLQHRNLVRLLGFCFENQEMILIFEFFHNKSLDHFLFDPEKRRLLDWTTRYVIIEGIARGLLYLHEESRIKIIHRDLKASNVLLDDNMNPKIADFGTARLLQLDQTNENTKRIAGTYGYMAPEYAIYGQISVKSDVFSFGVLLLEIICGQRNNAFYESNGVDDLGSYAWKNFMNGTPLALLDPSIGELYIRNEVIHCIHVGLLCVQYDPLSRPTMASVVIMLSSTTVTLPIPLQPAFFATSCAGTGNMMQPEQPEFASGRDVSFTELYPR